MKFEKMINKLVMKVAKDNVYRVDETILWPTSAGFIHEPKAPESLLKKVQK